MKAVVLTAFGGTEHFAMADLPMPGLRKGDVRIRVSAASFNPIDFQIRKGSPGPAMGAPMILGRDLSGVVEAVHEDVSDVSVGDEIYSYVCKLASSGTYAEYVSVPAELVARKPVALTHAQAAAVPVAALTATIALDKARVGPTRSVLVAGGAGGVGTFAIRLAQLRGVQRLVTTAGSAQSRAYLIEQCALRDDQIVDYHNPDFVAQAIARNGGPFDVALDLVGAAMLRACCALLAVDGDLASIVDAPDKDDFDVLFEKNASFHSVGAHAYSLFDDRRAWRKYRDMLDALTRAFASGALAAPSITVVGGLSVDTVREAHRLLENHAVQGKLVMTFGTT